VGRVCANQGDDPSEGSGLRQCVFVSGYQQLSAGVVGLPVQRHQGALFLLLDPGLHETAEPFHGSRYTHHPAVNAPPYPEVQPLLAVRRMHEPRVAVTA
jgi:hypothetical protein